MTPFERFSISLWYAGRAAHGKRALMREVVHCAMHTMLLGVDPDKAAMLRGGSPGLCREAEEITDRP